MERGILKTRRRQTRLNDVQWRLHAEMFAEVNRPRRVSPIDQLVAASGGFPARTHVSSRSFPSPPLSKGIPERRRTPALPSHRPHGLSTSEPSDTF